MEFARLWKPQHSEWLTGPVQSPLPSPGITISLALLLSLLLLLYSSLQGGLGMKGRCQVTQDIPPFPICPSGCSRSPRGWEACGPPDGPCNTLLEDGEQQTPGCPLLAQH